MKQRHSTRVTIVKTFQYLVLILMFLLLVGPFVWELSLSFKGRGDNVYAVPPYLSLQQYLVLSLRERSYGDRLDHAG